MDEFAVFIPIVALSIPIIAIIARTINKMIALREKEIEVQTRETAERTAQYAADKGRLEERVQVLERIVTDQGYSLANEIEQLRGLPSPVVPRHEAELQR